MGLDSKLELYTTLFGWLFYNSIWEVLVATGIVFLPFLGILIDTVIRTYAGEDGEEAGNTSLRILEVEFFVAFFVVMLTGVPAFPLSASEVSYTPRALINSPSQVTVTATDSQSTYGGTISFVGYPNNVDLPLFWYVILQFASGFNRSVIEDIPAAIDLRAYTNDLQDARINDPATQAEVNDFFRDCYIEARSRYLRERPNTALTESLLSTHGQTDTEWIGSHVFLETPGYYDSIRSDSIREGFPYSQLRDVEWDVSESPVNGKPFCNEWWTSVNGLAQRILDETDNLELVAAAVEPSWNPVQRRDSIIQAAMLNSPARWTNRGYDLAYGNQAHFSYQGDSIWASVLNRSQQALISYGLVRESLSLAAYLRIFLEAAPMLQALILMGLYALLPFFILVSRYRFSIFMTGALILFVVKFWTVLWYMAWWVDQNLILAFYSEPGSITTLFNFDMTLKRIVLNILTGLMYIVFPFLFTTYLAAAGFRAARGLDGATTAFIGNMSRALQIRGRIPRMPKAPRGSK